MYTILLLLSFVAFYCFYLASTKTKVVSSTSMINYLIQRPVQAKSLGYFLLFVSWVVFANLQGLGAGTFATLVYFMTFGSLLVLLKPYKYLTNSYFVLIIAISALIEVWFLKF